MENKKLEDNFIKILESTINTIKNRGGKWDGAIASGLRMAKSKYKIHLKHLQKK